MDFATLSTLRVKAVVYLDLNSRTLSSFRSTGQGSKLIRQIAFLLTFVFLVNSRSSLFYVPSYQIIKSLQLVKLIPKSRFYFAEFLGNVSPFSPSLFTSSLSFVG